MKLHVIIELLFAVAMAAACRHSKNERATVGTGPPASPTAPVAPTLAADAALALSSAGGADASAVSPIADAGEQEACNEQPPQAFLIDAHYNGRSLATAQARREWKDAVARSIRYRTEQYGYYPGFGSFGWNQKPLYAQMHTVKFFGLPVRLHERVIPALRCVEAALRRDCAATPYQPKALSGLREKNTYLDGDVSNHVYGIAIDIDPLQNPCCHCIEPWRSSPRCKGDKTDLERMDMPACWIGVFERFGFYWLGHDALTDTMHFEFLGDPAKIVKNAASAG